MKNITSSKIQKLFLHIFLLSILFFKIPSFYVLIFNQSPLFTTQAIARILLIVVFIYNLLIYLISNKNLVETREQKQIFSLVILLFAIQSFSILSAINVLSYLGRYKDIFIGIVAFFNFFFYRREFKKIISVFLIGVIINIGYQYVLFFLSDEYIGFFNDFIYQRQSELAIINLHRGRIHIDTYDEIVLPFIFLQFQSNILSNRISNYLLFLLISLFSFLSNWRIRIAMLLVSFLGSVIFLIQKRLWKFTLISLFLIISIFANRYLIDTVKVSFFDRFTLINEEDVRPLLTRVNQLEEAVIMGESSILGVGLGNYYDNLPSSQKIFFSFDRLKEAQSRIASEYVHNIFGLTVAETGYIGLIIFLLILIIFAIKDVKILKSNNQFKKASVIAFWTLFIYSLLNPPIPGTYQVLFWGIRGILFDTKTT